MGFQSGSIRRSTDPIEIVDLGTVEYLEAWRHQTTLVQRRVSGEISDTILLLQHPSTYTAGKRTQPEDLPTNGQPVVDVDRGGRITWHGPGQLVAYPIIMLQDPIDVVDYVRRIEEAVIATCHELGLTDAGRIHGRSGVWLPAGIRHGVLLPARKVAAIGIRVSHGVTMHGVAINCNNTLDFYEHIVPCGLSDAGVTTLSKEMGRMITVDDIAPLLSRHILSAFEGTLPLSTSGDPTVTAL